MNVLFRRFSEQTSSLVGSSWVFVLAVVVVLIWAFSGPLFGFSNTWQLVINTGTTIVTFLMVFLIQNTQNRDSKAIHLKLDELLKGVRGARTGLVNLEHLSDKELDRLQEEFASMHARIAEAAEARGERAGEEAGEEAGARAGAAVAEREKRRIEREAVQAAEEAAEERAEAFASGAAEPRS